MKYRIFHATVTDQLADNHGALTPGETIYTYATRPDYSDTWSQPTHPSDDEAVFVSITRNRHPLALQYADKPKTADLIERECFYWWRDRAAMIDAMVEEAYAPGSCGHGGYPRYAVDYDACCVLCSQCAADEVREALADNDSAQGPDVAGGETDSDRERAEYCEGCNDEIYPQVDYIDGTVPDDDADLWRDEGQGYFTTAEYLAKAIADKSPYRDPAKKTGKRQYRYRGATFTHAADDQSPEAIEQRHRDRQERNRDEQATRHAIAYNHTVPMLTAQLQQAYRIIEQDREKMTAAGYSPFQHVSDYAARITWEQRQQITKTAKDEAERAYAAREISFEQYLDAKYPDPWGAPAPTPEEVDQMVEVDYNEETATEAIRNAIRDLATEETAHA